LKVSKDISVYEPYLTKTYLNQKLSKVELLSGNDVSGVNNIFSA